MEDLEKFGMRIMLPKVVAYRFRRRDVPVLMDAVYGNDGARGLPMGSRVSIELPSLSVKKSRYTVKRIGIRMIEYI